MRKTSFVGHVSTLQSPARPAPSDVFFSCTRVSEPWATRRQSTGKLRGRRTEHVVLLRGATPAAGAHGHKRSMWPRSSAARQQHAFAARSSSCKRCRQNNILTSPLAGGQTHARSGAWRCRRAGSQTSGAPCRRVFWPSETLTRRAQTGRQRKAVATYREPSSSDDEAEASDDDTDDDAPAPRARAARGSPSGSTISEESDQSDEEEEELEQFCRKCKGGGEMICCDGDGCRASYHLGCLSPPLSAAPDGWVCPDCVGLDSLEEVERILDVRTVVPAVPTASPRSQQEYYAKFAGRSYRACSWMRRAELLATARRFPGIVARLRNFEAKGRERAYAAAAAAAADDADSGLEDQEDSGGMKHGVRSEWLLVERVIAHRAATSDREAEYLCKWQELDYSESTWESESSLVDFAAEIAAFEARGPIDASAAGTTARGKRTRRHELPPFEALTTMPSCLAGGSLHSYQLVGVNWLQSAHAAGTHVILADEMGLGASFCEPVVRSRSDLRPCLFRRQNRPGYWPPGDGARARTAAWYSCYAAPGGCSIVHAAQLAARACNLGTAHEHHHDGRPRTKPADHPRARAVCVWKAQSDKVSRHAHEL